MSCAGKESPDPFGNKIHSSNCPLFRRPAM
jgi:hypothetical protein